MIDCNRVDDFEKLLGVVHWVLLMAAVLLLLTGCGESKLSKQPESERTNQIDSTTTPMQAKNYRTKGMVRAVDEMDGILFIEHEDIPRVMPSMTMPFQLGNVASVTDFPAGTPVELVFQMDGSGVRIIEIARVDAEQIRLPMAKEASSGDSVTRLKPGDKVLPFRLIGEDGRALELADFGNRYVLMTFIFVRCPVPDFCPLLTKKFASIQKAVSSDTVLRGQVALLSVSFDEADTPEVLAEYAVANNADPAIWKFATGEPAEIDKLTRAFSVRVEKNGATIDHGLAVGLIDPQGTVVMIWRGNAWEPDDIVSALGQRLAAQGVGASAGCRNSFTN